jgi:hypothetical protein
MKLRRRMGSVTALAGLLTGVVLVVTAPAASAAELDKAGWWYRPNSAPGPLGGVIPPPPGTPEGGLVVQATPDGPNAVAAVTFLLSEEELGGTLTLTVAEGGDTGGEGAALQACPAKAAWEAAQAGSFDKRPQEDCNFGSVPGTRAEDGKTWTFDLTALVVSGKADVVIVPMALPEGGGQAPVFKPFSLSFEAPTSASLTPPEGSDLGSSDFTTEGGEFPAGDSGSFAPDSSGSLPSGSSDFAAPSVSGVDISGSAALDAAPPPPPAIDAAPAGSDQQALAAAPASATSGLANRRGLGLGLIALCGLAVLGIAATRSPAFAHLLPPAMRPAMGDGTPGGLGRFVRPRTGKAPAL